VEVLNEWQNKKMLGIDIKGCVEEIIKRLNAKCGYLKLDFKYFINKVSPVTAISAPMCYDCSFEGILDNYNEEDEDYRFCLGVKVPVTTLCPCSKEISDYGAHNQRAIVSVKITYPEDEHIWLEDIISLVEKSSSSELYPILKREDEKYVTEHAYNNPKFVEDVLRDVVLKLRKNDIIDSFEVECESLESIHNHSAWAYQAE
jgi:GTP cyclohydrolase I